MRTEPVGPRKVSQPVEQQRIERAKAGTEAQRLGEEVRAERIRASLNEEARSTDTRRRTPSVDVLA